MVSTSPRSRSSCAVIYLLSLQGLSKPSAGDPSAGDGLSTQPLVLWPPFPAAVMLLNVHIQHRASIHQEFAESLMSNYVTYLLVAIKRARLPQPQSTPRAEILHGRRAWSDESLYKAKICFTIEYDLYTSIGLHAQVCAGRPGYLVGSYLPGRRWVSNRYFEASA